LTHIDLCCRRSAYLAGATELRSGNFGTPLGADAPDIVAALSIPQLLDTVAIRINGPRAWSDHFFLSWNITDHKAIYVMELRNGVLNHKTADAPAKGSPVFTLTKNVLTGLLTGMVDPEKAVADGLLKIEGDGSKLATLLSYVDAPNPKFNIIEP
jgi:alkyl sulfatase BDS1-like metallo-beta-lactamase superfamily hydrolase